MTSSAFFRDGDSARRTSLGDVIAVIDTVNRDMFGPLYLEEEWSMGTGSIRVGEITDGPIDLIVSHRSAA
jgi:hypothetical protein